MAWAAQQVEASLIEQRPFPLCGQGADGFSVSATATTTVGLHVAEDGWRDPPQAFRRPEESGSALARRGTWPLDAIAMRSMTTTSVRATPLLPDGWSRLTRRLSSSAIWAIRHPAQQPCSLDRRWRQRHSSSGAWSRGRGEDRPSSPAGRRDARGAEPSGGRGSSSSGSGTPLVRAWRPGLGPLETPDELPQGGIVRFTEHQPHRCAEFDPSLRDWHA